jgi:hypothetical protein
MANDQRPSRRSRAAAKPRTGPGAKTGKRPTNLTLDADAVARGEQFARAQGASLSQLVNGFLHALPAAPEPALAPAVRRLFGIAAAGTADRESYREHLLDKYGRRDR